MFTLAEAGEKSTGAGGTWAATGRRRRTVGRGSRRPLRGRRTTTGKTLRGWLYKERFRGIGR